MATPTPVSTAVYCGPTGAGMVPNTASAGHIREPPEKSSLFSASGVPVERTAPSVAVAAPTRPLSSSPPMVNAGAGVHDIPVPTTI